MILTRPTRLVTVSVLCLVAMPASSAMGATKKAKKKAPVRPTVSSVAPMRAGVGDLLTIKGKNFLLGKKKNTVFFKAGNKPAVSVKADTATRTTMKVVVPKTVEPYLTVTGGVVQPTRFRLKILAKRFAKSYTAVRLSPTISVGNQPGGSLVNPVTGVSGDCDSDGIINSVDDDDDNDLLMDSTEVRYGLNPCSADTDADGIEDGWEYNSARDLNNTLNDPLPYPGKRPYPNPLDGTDAATDFDGDGLSMAQEHLLWKTFGAHVLVNPVPNYSAGKKKSNADFPAGSCTYATEDCNDGERDADNDLLSNWDEFSGRMQPGWWKAIVSAEKPYTESYDGLNAADSDTDGDGRIDGLDDVDHDLWTNLQELSRNVLVSHGADGPDYFRVQPFNPCLPDWQSPTCSVHPPPPAESYPPFDVYPLPVSPIVLGP